MKVTYFSAGVFMDEFWKQNFLGGIPSWRLPYAREMV